MNRLFSFKKPLIWILIAAVAISAVAAVCLWQKPSNTQVPEALDACIRSAIRDEYRSDSTAGKYPAVAYTVLDVKEKRDTVTVYGVMIYREYTCTTQDELKTWGTVHTPFAFTAKEADGTYEPVECWWPEEGAGYEKSVKKKFPSYLKEKVINFQRYYGPNDLACEADAMANVADADKYTVLQSERENVWLAYQEQGTHCYIVSSRGYSATGTTSFDGNRQQIFTFGTCKIALDINGNHRLYNTKDSQAVPTSWESYGETVYLEHGLRFSPVVRGATALVGDTLTIKSHNWMTEDEIRQMFGYVPNNSDATDSAASDKPYYLPVKVFTSRPQLDVLLSQHMMDSPWTDLKQATFTQFDEAFFEKNSLIMTYYKAGTDLPAPQVASYVYTEEGTCLSVRLGVDASASGDTVLTQWLLFSGIAKSDMEGVTVLESYAEKTSDASVIHKDTELSFTGKVTRVEGRSMLMESYDVDQFIQGVWVNLGDAELDPQVGEEYVVTYEDMVMPSLPPRITAVTITKP